MQGRMPGRCALSGGDGGGCLPCIWASGESAMVPHIAVEVWAEVFSLQKRTAIIDTRIKVCKSSHSRIETFCRTGKRKKWITEAD